MHQSTWSEDHAHFVRNWIEALPFDQEHICVSVTPDSDSPVPACHVLVHVHETALTDGERLIRRIHCFSQGGCIPEIYWDGQYFPVLSNEWMMTGLLLVMPFNDLQSDEMPKMDSEFVQ